MEVDRKPDKHEVAVVGFGLLSLFLMFLINFPLHYNLLVYFFYSGHIYLFIKKTLTSNTYFIFLQYSFSDATVFGEMIAITILLKETI